MAYPLANILPHVNLFLTNRATCKYFIKKGIFKTMYVITKIIFLKILVYLFLTSCNPQIINLSIDARFQSVTNKNVYFSLLK